MARTQAPDYEERREAIVARAAELFASRGFLGASISDLAEACRTSKSLIYHYYGSKEDILFDVMHGHVKALLDVAREVAARGDPPATKLRALTHEFMRLYLGAAPRQRVLLNELARLPEEERATIVGIQRALIEIVETLVVQLRPDLPAGLRRPATMLYFGMINWMHTWLNPAGAAKPEDIAELAVGIWLSGLRQVELA